MSGIDELRQNSSNEENVTLEIGGKTTVQRHRIITPKSTVPTQQPVSEENSERIVADLTNLPKGDENIPGVEVRESFVKDILEGENSMFGRYVKEKQQEAEQWTAQKEIEQEVDGVDEEEENNEPDFLGSTGMSAEVSLGTEAEGQVAMVSDNEGGVTLVNQNEIAEQQYTETNPTMKENIEQQVETPVTLVNENVEESSMSEPEEEINPELSTVEGGVSEESLDSVIVDEEETEISDEESLKRLQALATEKLKPVSHSLNISSFTVMKKPTTNLVALQSKQLKAAKWVAPAQESVILMKEFLGAELEQLREFSENTRDVSMLYRKYKLIYDHIVSAKPGTYEAWLKSTSYSDIDHYFFAVYIASFKGANYLPLECRQPKCNEQFLSDDVPIMDMVKFAEPKDREKFAKIYNSEQQNTNPKGIYVSEIVPLSQNLAVGFKDASVYSLLEVMSLDQRFRDKYSTIIDIIPYIDALYIIDQAEGNLIPIGYKITPDNVTKTIKSKIATFSKALKTLSVDEFGPIKSYINSITSRNNGITYRYPSVNCPKCGKPVEEINTTAEELVFTRYQLGALVNTSIK